MHDMPQKSDPATFEIVKNSLYKIAEEMRVVLAKTAYSPLLKSAGDYSCGVFDARGEMVAQGPDLPIHLGSMPDAVRAVVARFATDVHAGDVFVHNDPYFGGSHLPDVNVIRPAFHDGELLGYTCLRAHWPDIGSATPGSYGAVTQIFGEGLRIPPSRLISRGVLNEILKINIKNTTAGEPRWRYPQPFAKDLSHGAVAARRGRANIRPMRTQAGVAEEVAIVKCRPNHIHVRQMAAAKIGIIVNKNIAAVYVRCETSDNGANCIGHRAEVNGEIGALRYHFAPSVEDTTRIVAGRLQ